MMERRAAGRPTRSRVLLVCSLIVGTLLVGAHPAAASPPANGEPPALTGMEANGDVYVGSTLYATAGRWSGVPSPTYTYRWQYRATDGTWPDIAGATGPTYEVRASDLGYPLRVNVTAANSDGNAEQVSAQTTAVKNAPPQPPTPPDPPPDVLGSPLNSRVVSADDLLITRDAFDGSQHRQDAAVATTDGNGQAEPFNIARTGQVQGGDHFLPRVTAAGRFTDQDFDSVLTLEGGLSSTFFEEGGDSRMVLRSTSADMRATWTGVPAYSLQDGTTYVLYADGRQCQEDACLLSEVPVGSGPASNVMGVLPGEEDDDGRIATQQAWTAAAIPGESGVFALINRASGRCLEGGPVAGEMSAIAVECDGEDPSQQWTTNLSTDPESAINLINRGTGLALTRSGNRFTQVTLAPLSGSGGSSAQRWSTFEHSLFKGQLRQDVPSYGFAADPLTYTMTAGDLDRVSEHGDTYTYHDEAVLAWVPDSASPQKPTVRVVDYVSSGVTRPVPVDLAADLPAPGEVRTVNGSPAWFPGSLGLAAGDFDGDSLNEIAYTWQDASGTFRVTMLEYRRNADQSRSLHVVGPVDGIPLFTGSGAPTPRLEAGLAETKAGDFDGDGRDDLAIAFAATPANGDDATAHLGVVSFTQALGVRGQQRSELSTQPVFVSGPRAGLATRGLRLAPGLFRVDPDVGYTMERRQLAVAWTDEVLTELDTNVAVYSIDPDPSCTQATCDLAVDVLAAPRTVSLNVAQSADYPHPLSLAAGGFRGRGAGEAPPVWGLALTVNDAGETTGQAPDGHLYTTALAADANAASGFSLSAPQDVPLDSGAGAGTTELYSLTAFDPAGESLVLGAPAVVQVQGLRRATMVAAQPPTHADWDWDLSDSSSGKKGAFADVSRFSNFTVTLGSTATKEYQHTHTHDTTWNGGVTESVDVKGSFNNDLVVESSSGSLEAKQKFQYKWTGSGSDFSNSTSQTSVGLTQTSDDDDLFQGAVEDSTLYRYPILGGPLRDANGDPVSGANCGDTCFGVYEVSIPGRVVPIATGGRSVDFFQPSWENGNALSYPVMTGGAIPTPDLGPYSYVDQNGTTQSVTTPLLSQEFGVGGASTKASVDITGTTGSGNSSGSGNSWDLSGDVKATATYRMGPKAVNYTGSVSVDVGGFGGQTSSTNDTGQTINTSASSFDLNVPEITPNYGYDIGTSYYYDKAGAARIGMAVDLTSNNESEWWDDNYGRQPDPALNLPNRVILITNPFNNLQIVPAFATDARHQLIRGFQAFHTNVAASPSLANKEYTTNPADGDEVSFRVPVRNYSLIPASNVSVTFYAVPMKYDGAVKVPAGPPVAIGDPQTIPQIPAQGTANVSSPVWKALGPAAGIRPWRIFVVLDKDDAVDEIHEWKDSNGACPVGSLDPQPPNGTVIDGVMVDPMTGQASGLACGQNNQGFGEISVSASAPAASAEGAGTRTVLDLAARLEPGAPGVHLTGGGVHSADRSTAVIDPGEVARVREGEQMLGVAYVGSKGESPYHQTVLVYDGPPEKGELIAVTTLRGATASGGHRVEFTWRAEKVGRHTLYVRLLGHVAAGEDDLLTIPVLVEKRASNTAPVARDDAYSTREGRRLTVRAPGVLRNDRDAEGSKLTATRVNGPEHGSLGLNGDGSFTYRPERGFTGRDGFAYRAGDAPLASDPARVTIRVRRLPRCQGRRATIVGTRRSDRIRGTARADVIVALGGRDRIRAGRGDDRVCAGRGRDVVVAGAGRDRILGGTDGDRLHGGRGSDLVDGGRGHDALVGGRGEDALIGRAGRDRLLGKRDGDTLAGGPGNDLLVGGTGRNRLFGGLGDDTLVGRRGRDLIRGGPGRNRLLRNLRDAGPVGRRPLGPGG